MGAMYVRGGRPHVVAATALAATAAAEQQYEWPLGVSNWLHFENLDPSSQITIYVTAEDAADEVHGIVVPAGLGSPGNPFTGPFELERFWLRSAPNDAAFSCLLALRRG